MNILASADSAVTSINRSWLTFKLNHIILDPEKDIQICHDGDSTMTW